MHRRDFVRTSAAALGGAAAFGGISIVPRHVLGGPGVRAPSDTVTVAGIGVGGQGMWNLTAMRPEARVVAMADVDWGYVDEMFAERATYREDDGSPMFPELPEIRAFYDATPKYADFRRMLDERTDIDAVVVATPDHTHAVAALAAMGRGKHVFVQKPLTYNVAEARALKAAAAKTGLVTQMGNQGHSGDDGRRVVEMLRGGAIGTVREVTIWTNRPHVYWPQGFARPTAVSAPPPTLDWDLFLGPAREQPYVPGIHPFSWRGWVEFGGGALGDMGAHLMDFPFWALGLGMPTRVETRASPMGGEPENPDTYPVATITTYDFDQATAGPVRLTWFDGGLMPPTPREAPAGFKLDPGGGVMYTGSRGLLVHETYGESPRLLPESLSEAADAIPQSLPRIPGGSSGHELNWLRAIRGEAEPSCPFSYAADLTEVMHLGVVALRAGVPIEYDAATMTIPNAPDAERFLRRTYRAGWELPTV